MQLSHRGWTWSLTLWATLMAESEEELKSLLMKVKEESEKVGLIELPYDPAIPLLGIHTEETRRERDMCIPMFIAALFIIAIWP